MEFALDNGNASYQIKAYRKGSIIVNKQTYNCSILIMPELLIAPWEVDSFESLTSKHFEILLPHKPQVVLLGTGETSRFPDVEIFSTLIEHKIGFEVMSTAAACRTYMLLMAEGRHVAATLLC